jgi:hypothetical protein
LCASESTTFTDMLRFRLAVRQSVTLRVFMCAST